MVRGVWPFILLTITCTLIIIACDVCFPTSESGTKGGECRLAAAARLPGRPDGESEDLIGKPFPKGSSACLSHKFECAEVLQVRDIKRTIPQTRILDRL